MHRLIKAQAERLYTIGECDGEWQNKIESRNKRKTKGKTKKTHIAIAKKGSGTNNENLIIVMSGVNTLSELTSVYLTF